MKKFELLNNLLKQGTINTVEEFEFIWENSYLEVEGTNFTLNIRSKEMGTIISVDLNQMIEYFVNNKNYGYDNIEADAIDMFRDFTEDWEDEGYLKIDSKYDNLEEIAEDLRDYDLEETFKNKAYDIANNVGCDGCYVTYELKMNDEYKLYLEYMAIEHPTDGQVAISKIFYDECDDCFQEHDLYANEIIPFEK